MTDQGPAITSGALPAQRVSKPEFLDWHMILDHELSLLTRSEAGVVSSLGFAGVGGVLGLVGPLFESLAKIGSAEKEVLFSDFVYILFFGGSFVLAAVCLTLTFISWQRNKGLADQIRKRPKS